MAISVLYQVGRVARLTGTLIDEALTGSDLTGTDFAVYSFLVVHGSATISEIAESTGTQLPTTSKLLAKAERLGHVERRKNPDDRRSSIVELTESGRQVHASVKPEFGAALNRVNQALGESFDDITWALERLSDALTAAINRTAPTDTAPPPATHSLAYSGKPLTESAEAAVKDYIDFLHWKSQASQ